MAIVRDLLMVLVLATLATWLPAYFLDYRGTVVRDQHNQIVQTAPPGLVFATDTRTLDVTDTVVENGKSIANPGAIIIQNGFYARSGYSVVEAVIGGIVIPLLVIFGAAHFVARARRKSRQWAPPRGRTK